MNSQWDGSQGLSNPQDPALVFTDDLMLDFGMVGQVDPLMVDDLGFQDMQDLPWYVAISMYFFKISR